MVGDLGAVIEAMHVRVPERNMDAVVMREDAVNSGQIHPLLRESHLDEGIQMRRQGDLVDNELRHVDAGLGKPRGDWRHKEPARPAADRLFVLQGRA
jgi:hypothetical protein